MPLDEYRRKRRPGRTPEPGADEDGGGGDGRPVFVVQRHDARRLHYDLRLEMNGALASWALPKGLPLETGERYLAVHTEDHPMKYASFEGVIPKGEYGAGTMEIWDRGTYELVERKRDGGLTVRLDGERLQGTWTLVPAKLGGDEKNWLVIREVRRGRRRPHRPAGYAPMLATPAERLPARGRWLHEVKWDGYRVIARLEGGEASLTSRRGVDLGSRFAAVARALPHALRTSDCVVDGELCMLDPQGRPSFSLMQRGEGAPAYYLFDLLELEREPLIELPLEERRERLSELLVRGQPAGAAVGRIRRRPGAAGRGQGAGSGGGGRQAAGHALPARPPQPRLGEGEVAARGRLPDPGLDAGAGIARALGALVLAEPTPTAAVAWAGNVGSGLDERSAGRPAAAAAEPLEVKTPPLEPVPRLPKTPARLVRWVEPRLRARVSSPSAPATAACARRCSSAWPTSSPRKQRLAGGPSPTPTSCSSPTTASPRATCSPTTRRWRRWWCPT